MWVVAGVPENNPTIHKAASTTVNTSPPKVSGSGTRLMNSQRENGPRARAEILRAEKIR